MGNAIDAQPATPDTPAVETTTPAVVPPPKPKDEEPVQFWVTSEGASLLPCGKNKRRDFTFTVFVDSFAEQLRIRNLDPLRCGVTLVNNNIVTVQTTIRGNQYASAFLLDNEILLDKCFEQVRANAEFIAAGFDDALNGRGKARPLDVYVKRKT